MTSAERLLRRGVTAAAIVLFAISPVFAQPSQTAKPIPFTDSQAAHGRTLFEANCAACHGPTLEGGPGGPPVKGGAFRQRFQLQPGDALFTFIRTKMPPGNAGVLTAADYADLTAYILAANGAKGGELPLQADAPFLEPLSFTATLPPLPVAHTKTRDVPQKAREGLSEGLPPDGFVNDAARRGAERLQKLRVVTDAMLRSPPDGDWINPRRTYDAQAFSPLAEISTANVGKLQMAWSWELAPSEDEITPLVHDGILFIASNGRLQALDAVTGDLLWQYTNPTPVGIVRSLAIYGENIFYPAETDLVALNMRSGAVVWRHPLVTAGYGVRLAAGPLIVKGMVLQGTSLCIGAFPGGCYLSALDAATGKELWRFNTLARPGQIGGDSWNHAPVDERLGGAIWAAGSYDPELDLIYFGVGQTYKLSTLLKDYDGTPGGNDGLYTDTTLALRPETGELVWHYQHLKRDVWDLDWAFERTVATIQVDGKPRKTITTGGKLSIFDTLDAATGKYLFSYDVGLQNLVTSIDPQSGDKKINPAYDPKPNEQMHFCPSLVGGRNWPATAFNAKTGILYVPLNEACADFTWVPGSNFEFETRFMRRDDSDGLIGRLEAIDVASRKALWVQRRRAPESSAILATAGGLIFDGSRDRWFRASDARTGKVLWQTKLNAPPSSYPVTFSADGVQYVAVVAGGGGPLDNAGGVLTPEIPAPGAGTTLWVFRLPEKN